MQTSPHLRSSNSVEWVSLNFAGAERDVGCIAESGASTTNIRRGWAAKLISVKPIHLIPKLQTFSPRSTRALLAVNVALIIAAISEFEFKSQFSAMGLAADSGYVESLPEIEPIISDYVSRATFDDISYRPLFEPSRRRHLPGSSPALDRELTLGLIGTYLSDKGRTALVRLGAEASAVWLREGDYVDGWRIEEIRAGRLQLRLSDEIRIVHLWPDA